MTTKADLARLFHFSKDAQLIVGFGGLPQATFDRSRQDKEHIAVSFELADPTTYRRSGQELRVVLSSLHAIALAKAILASAKELGIEEPPGLQQVVREVQGKKLN